MCTCVCVRVCVCVCWGKEDACSVMHVHTCMHACAAVSVHRGTNHGKHEAGIGVWGEAEGPARQANAGGWSLVGSHCTAL